MSNSYAKYRRNLKQLAAPVHGPQVLITLMTLANSFYFFATTLVARLFLLSVFDFFDWDQEMLRLRRPAVTVTPSSERQKLFVASVIGGASFVARASYAR